MDKPFASTFQIYKKPPLSLLASKSKQLRSDYILSSLFLKVGIVLTIPSSFDLWLLNLIVSLVKYIACQESLMERLWHLASVIDNLIKELLTPS